MGSGWFLLAVVVVAITMLVKNILFRDSKLPPGPVELPILGYLPFLGPPNQIHLAFQSLSQRYGPILLFHMGSIPTVVISDVQAAEEVMKTKDAEFCSKPHSTLLRTTMAYMNFDGNQIGMMPYSPQVQFLKKICTTELSSLSRINASEKVRTKEISRTVMEISATAKQGELVNLAELSHSLFTNLMTRTLFGKSYHGRNIPECEENIRFISTVRNHLKLASTLNPADLLGLPGMRWLDILGIEERSKKLKPQLEGIYQNIINERRRVRETRHRDSSGIDSTGDLLDSLLDLQGVKKFPDHAIMAVLSDMFVGGTDASSVTLQWFFMELMQHPDVFARLQNEIDTVVGREKRVGMADLSQMPYLEATAKEILRLHHPTPLLLPRMNECEAQLGGYTIPKQSTIFINAWAINRDPKYWESPLTFNPERFMNSNVSIYGNDFQFLPFGSGRRKCPGINLGMANLHLSIAALLHAFDWSLPAGVLPRDINMEGVNQAVMTPKDPLHVVARPKAWASHLY